MFESDARTQVRIDNLVSYLEKLQVPSRQSNAGQDLFRVNCAVCHGVDARGAGPMSSQLRRLPPSLTSYCGPQWRRLSERAAAEHHRRTNGRVARHFRDAGVG
jgi:cytochrome c553